MNANTFDSPGTKGGNREDLRNVLTILEPEDAPFTSMCRKGPGPAATFVEVLADTLRKPRNSGTREGKDAGKGGNKAVNRKRFGTYVHRVMDEYGVTDVQEAISRAGGVAAVSDEYGNSKAKCVREVKRDIESILCGSQEHQGGTEDEMRTRGAFTWLSTSAQTQNPVDANFLTLAASCITGVGTTAPLFTEAAFNAHLKSLKTVYGGKREYDVIAGNTVIETVDNFTRVQPNSVNTRYQVHEMADEHEITLMVQIFESSFGRCNMIPTEFNNISAAGIGDPSASLTLNRELWEMDFLENIHAMDLPEEGGGPNGYVRAMLALLCLNPKGNGKITQ